MKKVNAWEESFSVEKKEYKIVLLETIDIQEKCYDIYVDNWEEPMMFMFRIPAKGMSVKEAIDLGIKNSPDYIRFFED